jgi:hypothetical protein
MLAKARALDDERQIRQPKNWGAGRKPALPDTLREPTVENQHPTHTNER